MRKKALHVFMINATNRNTIYIFNVDIFDDDIIHIGIMMIIVQLI